MSLRVLCLLYAVILTAATFQLKPLPLVPPYVVVTNANTRVPAPQVTAIRFSSTTTTPTDERFSVAVDVAHCAPATCQVAVFVYSAPGGVTQLPPVQGRFSTNVWMQGVAGGPNSYNTSYQQGEVGGYVVWQPFSSGRFPNGPYNVVVRVIGAGDLDSFYSASDLAGLGGAPVILSGSSPSPSPLATVTYFDIWPRTVTDTTLPLHARIRLAGRVQDYQGSEVNIFCAKSMVYYLGALQSYAYADAEGWVNISYPLTGAPSTWFANTVADLQIGARDCSLQIYPVDNSPLSITAAQLRASGFDPSITLSGASFSSDVTPPNCTFSFDAATFAAGAGAVQVNGVCDGNGYGSTVLVVPPTATPRQTLFGFSTAYGELGEGVNIPQDYVGGNYGISYIAVNDKAGNLALYSNNDPPVSVDVFQQAFGEGGFEVLLLAAYEAGEFNPSGATTSDGVASAVYVYVVLLLVLSLSVVLSTAAE